MVYKPNDKQKSKKHEHNSSASSSVPGSLDQVSVPSSLMVGPPPTPNNNSVGEQMMDSNLRNAGPIGPPKPGAPVQGSMPPLAPGGGLMHQQRGGMKGGPRHGPPGPKPTVEPMPLREAAMMEIKSLPSKTPVSVLQELLSRRGTTPKYELVQVEGAIHEPTFRYRVSVAPDVVAQGTGRSKKEAKHTAAKAVLDSLIAGGGGGGGGAVVVEEEERVQVSHNSSFEQQKMMGNPIGLLQELCMSRRWPPPSYETEHEEGLPHERQFTICCLVYKYKEIGTGKSKKLAKRQAANKMWVKLKDMPIENNQYSFEDDEEMIQRISNKFTDLKDTKISTLNTQTSLKVSQFHKNLKSAFGVKLNELQSAVLKFQAFNYVQFLQEIASEQQFEVTYVDIEEKSITGKCQCLVQLSTLPVAVCHGQGATSKEAQTQAALNALEYLKIMTKK
ncbi:RISC-loading complex subunit tarbp2 isoform X1 [Nilaparvata lugens]|uniref:RISC-loading complex subunit tarbp2 isoform X1 n=1 Tax=Nilaparvata lugens TaxID=108931 RepID=UPI00193DFC34|nr:RISC-loading complex subunit tarbp2 isoform X1 [Nilaparvata lugens]